MGKHDYGVTTVPTEAQSGVTAIATGLDYNLALRDDTPPTLVLAGDLNTDGQVTVADALLALQVAIGTRALSPQALTLADVAPKRADGTYGDGVVGVNDAIRILRRAVGLELNPWP